MSERLLILALMMVTSLGCGSKRNGAGPAAAVKRVKVSVLPALGDPLAGLDNGRVTISPPANWFVFTEDTAKYIAKFSLFKRGDSPLPLIVVTVEDSPFAELKTVTEESLEDFAVAMAEIKKEKGEQLFEKIRPMMIGEVPCIRYVKKANFKFHVPRMQIIRGERQMIQMLANGRLYTVDLRLREETITKYRDQAYAVVAGMKFSSF